MDAVEQVTVAGVQALVLVVFLTQTIVEAVPRLQGRLTPVVAAVVGLLVAGVATLAPAPVQQVLGVGLALGASASLAVRYVKRGDQASPASGEAGSLSIQNPVVVDFGAPAEQDISHRGV